MIREQNFRKGNENYDENKLIEIESVDTVSIIHSLFNKFLYIGSRLLDALLTYEKANGYAIWYIFACI